MACLGVAALGASDLGSAQLRIAGSRLTASPESQAVPFDTPTQVETHLEGYDPAHGILPRDLRVLADFTGPEIDGILVLETLPNQPFRIPRLRLEGEYRLDNIRLVQGNDLLGYAQPRSAAVVVTQILVTRVTSRALTLDEIRSYGIVVNDDSFQAFNFTFAFAIAGETVNYNVPVIYSGPAGDQQTILFSGPNFEAPPWRSSSARFEPPRLAPFQLHIDTSHDVDSSNGGCDDPEGDCNQGDVVPIPGVILFPTDVGLLHQFFAVTLLAQNGAPAGSRLVLRDLTAKVTLPPGLRQAETQPPTPLGVPVPIRVPGPDGELGTADDLTFLVAQATGKAETLVEGLREGTHVVRFDLEGVLEGLPGGVIRRVSGQASGAVIVRDPSLNITITHPDTVRTDEEYAMLLTVTNTGTAPANLLKVRLPPEKLSGVTVVGENEKTVTIAPGDSEIVEFRLLSRRTGRVTSTAARSSSAITPTFELTVGVGENGIPLSPNAIILPRSTAALAPDLVRQSLNLIGLGFSLATAPASLLRPDLPRVSRSIVDSRVYQLAQAGRHMTLGEEAFDSLTQLAVEWSGGRDADWEWDRLRRTTQKGARVGALLGATFAAETAATSPEGAFERFGRTATSVAPVAAVLAVGAGLRLEVASQTSGSRLSGSGDESSRRRDLPFGDLFALGGAELALLAVPEAEGYVARLRAASPVSGAVQLLLPARDGPDGTPRRVTWLNVLLDAGGEARLSFRAADEGYVLAIDREGDGSFETEVPGVPEPFARRPFEVLAARQDAQLDPSGHVVDVLLSGDLDPTRLVPPDPRRFSIPGKVSNGGTVQAEQDAMSGSGATIANLLAGMRNARVVRVVFSNPLSPYVIQTLTVSDLYDRRGTLLTPGTVPVQTSAAMPGTLVEGKVYGSDGRPVPFAEVELRESDRCLFCAEQCRSHKTAAVRADAAGAFLFDYVRQTDCGDGFQIRATDVATGRTGSATGRARLVGQHTRLDVVMLGRGSIRGKVAWDDGAVPESARVWAYSPVFREGRSVLADANGNYALTEIPVGTITLSATDGQGRYTLKTIEIPEAGSDVTRDLVILRAPGVPQASGTVRGTVARPSGDPVAGAYVALYLEGSFLGSRRSGADGRFDFGLIPAGQAEIETFEGETGISGGQIFFPVHPDQVNEVTPILRDDRGTVRGHVYRQAVDGSIEPLFGIVVWAEGTPFHTVTSPDGSYQLEGVFVGGRTIYAADLANKLQVGEIITITAGGQVVDRNLYFRTVTTGGVAGEVLDTGGNPVVNATVHLAVGDQFWFKTATTGADGRFLIPDLAPGSYSVHGFKGVSGAARPATIRFPGDTPFVSLRFKRGAIHGVVEAENDSGVALGVRALVTYRTTVVRLELVGLDIQSHTLETAADGTFEIPNVLAGPYVLSVSNAFYGDRTVRGELFENGEVKQHTITFERHATGTVGGRVLGPDGVTPVVGATIQLRHPAFSDYDLVSDDEGRFRFELVPPTDNAFRLEVTSSSGVVFRTAEAWVRLTQGGQDLDVDVVLPKQGSVSGRVLDSNGDVVPGALVTVQEGSYPRRLLVANADGAGAFAFQNLFAGTLTLSARAPALGGLGGKTTVILHDEGEEIADATITLEPTGRIAGLVTSPVDGSAVASAEVRLLRDGSLFDTVTAGPDGRFQFALLPLDVYTVRAFDPRTGRVGRRDNVTVAANNQEVSADVLLQARGTVEGHLYEAGSTTAVPGATLRMQTGGIESFATYSSTGADGAYAFEGIPQGTFTIYGHEPQGRRGTHGQGEVTTEGEHVTLDLSLEALYTLYGSVLNPRGAPAGLFPHANTVLTQDGQVIGSTVDSTYSFPGLVVGHGYELTTTEIGGGTRPHRGYVLGGQTVPPPGGQVQVDIQMHAMADVSIDVVDGAGVPVPGVSLNLWTEGPYDWSRFRGDTGANGSLVIPRIEEGRISATAYNPLNGLYGGANGWVIDDGTLVHLRVPLENAAQLHGKLVKADGASAAGNAFVAVQTYGGRFRTTRSDEAGLFTVLAVPLGDFVLTATEDQGPGSREKRGELVANNQDLDLGTLVLDDRDPTLVAVEPAAGAVDVPLSARPLVRFSEPIDPTHSLLGNSIHLERADGSWVNTSLSFEEGGAAVRITPLQPLPNFSSLRLKVGQDVYDLAGRRLDHPTEISFNTIDGIGPSVLESTPTEATRQVALGTPLRVLWSEPVTPSSLSGSAIQLLDTSTSAGQSLTFQLDAAGRSLVVTPVAGLAGGHRYRLTLQGVTDAVGNAMAAPFQLAFQALDAEGPATTFQQPAAGASFTSGARIAVAADVADFSALGIVTLKVGDQSYVDAAAPYAWDVPAPRVSSAQDLDLTIEAVDEWGNHSTVTRSIHVEPRSNAQTPTVTLSCLPAGAVPGAPLVFPLRAQDDQGIESYRLKVDGALVATYPVDAETADLAVQIPWTVPAAAPTGVDAAVRIEAIDFAGNVGAAELALPIHAGSYLSTAGALDSTRTGAHLVLGPATFTLPASLQLASLTLLPGAHLQVTGSGTTQLTVAGRAGVACGATIDAVGSALGGGLEIDAASLALDGQIAAGVTTSLHTSGALRIGAAARVQAGARGFAGGVVGGNTSGGAPAGVAAAQLTGGGSHGGSGGYGYPHAGTPGAVYDSVAMPALAGGGGAIDPSGPGGIHGGAGGGAVRIEAGELELLGAIEAKGESRLFDTYAAGGAGGSVWVSAGTLSGGGSIDASGGDAGACGYKAGAGGGGRVALVAGTLSGFDPALQVKAWSGRTSGCGGPEGGDLSYAAPGTIYWSDSASTYGRLLLDAGQAAGADRKGLDTELPALTGGAVTAWSVAGSDAWLTAGAPLGRQWAGAWVKLRDGAGAELGTGFRVNEVDGSGRLRLAGAAALSGVAGFGGEYRFDSVDLRHGAGLRSASPISGTTVAFQGDNAVAADVVAVNVVVKAGAVVHPAAGNALHFQVAGKLTVEAGGKIAANGTGYAGGVVSGPTSGSAPAGRAAAQLTGGGSHGGSGGYGYPHPGSPGAVYDSVSRPALAGGGGAIDPSGPGGVHGGAGGGVVRIEAGELDLAGTIEAKGETRLWDTYAAGGAGGSVWVSAGILSGAGSIDASGGDAGACSYKAGGGGGGRISVQVATLNGFDPAAQAKAWSGYSSGCGGFEGGDVSYAAPGTVFWSDASSTYGRLLLDAGRVGSTDRKGVPTELPALAGGAVSAWSAAGGDAWLTAAAPLGREWVGSWVTLRDGAGAPLGAPVQAIDVDAAGRILLSGTGSIVGQDAATFAGEYRFDAVDLRHGAGLASVTSVQSGDLSVAGSATLALAVKAASVTVKQDALVRPGASGELRFDVAGLMTVESGARVLAVGTGFTGGQKPSPLNGAAPAGVAGSEPAYGGSHGGTGAVGASNPAGSQAGAVFDSLYLPHLGGGGGAAHTDSIGARGGAGGGVLSIQAGELDLRGSLEATGEAFASNDPAASAAGGAGGTVRVAAGILRGAGSIDASGRSSAGCGPVGGAGGGGRVLLDVGQLVGFTPATQVAATGGALSYCNGPGGAPAAPGTVLTRVAPQLYGDLRVDDRLASGSILTVPETVLPIIGSGVVGAIEADTADPTDLWITPQESGQTFGAGSEGAWLRLRGADRRILALSADRRQALVDGAAGATALGEAFLGVYKLDGVAVAGRARLRVVDGLQAASSSVETGSNLAFQDLDGPALALQSPAAGATLSSGDPVAVAATASDPSGVTSVVFHLGDRSFTDTAAPYEWTAPAPRVAEAGDLALTVEAHDSAGNVTTLTRTVHVSPVAAGADPAVAVVCSSSAILAPGMSAAVEVSASHASGIDRVELFLGTTLLSTDLEAPFGLTLSVPAGTADGTTLAYRIRTTAFSGAAAELLLPVKVVSATVLDADRTLASGDASLDGTSVIVAAGTLTVSGPHTLRDLVVLDGAKVVPAETTASVESLLDLTVQRDVYVGCGGRIDADGRGYLGATSEGARAFGYPNTQAAGANAGVAGGHGGRGGRFDGSSPIYGSFFDPKTPGAGGGYSSDKGGDGGGVIRLTASGSIRIDGAVSASGESGNIGAGGAGGSIRLNAAALGGAGVIQARGSAGSIQVAGGAGGRIALYGAAIDAGLLARTTAFGAATSGSDPAAWGAAGTVFVKPDAQGFGDLILDNGGTMTSQLSELLSVGSGVVDAVSSDGFTDNEADFVNDLRAIEVAFNGDLGNLFAVLGHAHHGTSLTLSVPTPPLSAAVHAGDTYRGLYRFHRVVVRGGARGVTLDGATSELTPEVQQGSSWSESYAPTVQLTSPTAGATVHPGDALVVSADATDVLGLREVELRIGSSSFHDTAVPYSWTTTVPNVAATTDLTVSATALDLASHRITASRTVHVVPLVDSNLPVVTLGGCPADGDVVLPGTGLTIAYSATDDQGLATVKLVVDGSTIQTLNVSGTAASGNLSWTLPASAAAGTAFELRVEARDAGGALGVKTYTVYAMPAAALAGPQTLDSSFNGQSLVLRSGTFTVSGPVSLAALTVAGSATVVPTNGETLALAVTGKLRVQCGAAIDGTARGYAGATVSNSPGTAPAGVTASGVDAGGSHGGVGLLDFSSGPVGDVYDSVYKPRLAGGGGSLGNSGVHGGNGGGAIAISAAEVQLDGAVKSQGETAGTTWWGQTDAGGAGGSVLITTGTLSGTGTIDVTGGVYNDYYYAGASGGGGRIGLWVDVLNGFDPVAQAKAGGGAFWHGGDITRYAGPGTVFVKQATDTYGRLIVDSGKDGNGNEKVGPVTPLPVLGSGAVSAFTASGSDARVTGPAAFKAQWVGAWMALQDGTGASLGTFRVLSLDGQGTALLAGAGSRSGVASYRGQYRFDRVDLKAGAGVSHSDELFAGTMVAEPKTRLPATLSATSLTIKPGAAVTPAQSGTLQISLSGRLTVESGAVLDASGMGYAGATAYNGAGAAPAGVTASGVDAGGSHGGLGLLDLSSGPVGDVYDSVYQPSLGGGGGSRGNGGVHGGNGGGVIAISAAEVQIDGVVRSQGETPSPNWWGDTDSGGAGGSVLITASSLSGAGTIDVTGGAYNDYYHAGASGGGGRIALWVDSSSGFDPVAQAKAWGGAFWHGGNITRYAGTGTVLVKQASDTYGRLIVDSGKETNGTERIGPVTPLPVLGSGAVSVFTAAGSDARVTGPAAFKAQWVGAWMALQDGTGASLGSFRVLALDGQGRALLAGAGSLSGVASYRGQYRFDRVDLKAGAGVSHSDELFAGTMVAEPKTRLPATLSAASLTIKPGAAVTPAQSGTLQISLSGRLTVESGAVLDASGMGYAGATAYNSPGAAPAGVTASGVDAGGSHGGPGLLDYSSGPVGDVYDSVYQPSLGGGGGSRGNGGVHGGNGGGVIAVSAAEVQIDGVVRSQGETPSPNWWGDTDSGGAGGSVLITAGSLSGTGTIDVAGGAYNDYYHAGASGGGGRIALWVDSLSGFDLAAQARAWGGAFWHGGSITRYSGTGTVFVKLPSQTYGKLYVDQGGTSGNPIPNTPLPSLGTGTLGTTTADTANAANLWVEPSDANAKFALGASGMWLRVGSTDYRVLDQTADRRKLLLQGAAATVASGDSYRGVYKFDQVIVHRGAKLEFRDTNVLGSTDVDSTSSIIQNVP